MIVHHLIYYGRNYEGEDLVRYRRPWDRTVMFCGPIPEKFLHRLRRELKRRRAKKPGDVVSFTLFEDRDVKTISICSRRDNYSRRKGVEECLYRFTMRWFFNPVWWLDCKSG